MDIFALITVFLIGLFIQKALFHKLIFRKLVYRCSFSINEAYEGEELTFIETVNNDKLFPVPWLRVEINSSKWLEFGTVSSVISADKRYISSNFVLKGKQKISRHWKSKCLKRGVFNIDKVTLISGDILGLQINSTPQNVNAQLTVFPNTISLEDLFVPANYLQGDTVAKRWIIDDPFMITGMREYMPGDPLNRVNWSATARTGQLMVSKHDFTSQLSYSIFLNIQSQDNEYYGTLDKDVIELGIKVAATILQRASRTGIATRLITNGRLGKNNNTRIATKDGSSSEHMKDLLKILAGLDLSSTTVFEHMIEDAGREVFDTDAIIITAYLTDRIYKCLKELKSRRNRVVVILLDDAETYDLPGDIELYTLKEKMGKRE